MEIEQKHIDHFWNQFKNARISGDFSEPEVFAETIRSFARWHEERIKSKDDAAIPASNAAPGKAP